MSEMQKTKEAIIKVLDLSHLSKIGKISLLNEVIKDTQKIESEE